MGDRFPVDPLLAVLRSQGRSVIGLGRAPARDLHRLRHTGLTVWQADKWACRLGYHPASVWGHEWFAGVEA